MIFRTLLLLAVMLPGSIPALAVVAIPPDPFDPFEEFEIGNNEVELTHAGKERQRLNYLVPRLNSIYQEYWKNEDFDFPGQGKVALYPTPRFDQGITVFFSIDEELARRDENQQQHYRLGRMFISELKKHTSESDAIEFFVAVDTSGTTGERVLQDSRNVRYLIPDEDNDEEFPESAGTPASETFTESDLLLLRFELLVSDISSTYSEYLNYSGFNYREHAYIEIQEHPYHQPGFLVVFRINEELAAQDPEHEQHKRISDNLQPVVDEAVENFSNDIEAADFAVQVEGEVNPQVLD